MNKQLNEKNFNEIKSILKNAKIVLIINDKNITSLEIKEIRKKFFHTSLTIKKVKNRIIKHAITESNRFTSAKERLIGDNLMFFENKKEFPSIKAVKELIKKSNLSISLIMSNERFILKPEEFIKTTNGYEESIFNLQRNLVSSVTALRFRTLYEIFKTSKLLIEIGKKYGEGNV